MNTGFSRAPLWLQRSMAGVAVVLVLQHSGAVGDQQSVPTPSAPTGQTRMLLPDGRWLVLGSDAVIEDPERGVATPFLTPQHIPRLWHTATVLPDGSVLVLGGRTETGRPVSQVELLNPETRTSRVVEVGGWHALFGHSATVLNDHEVLIAGGIADTSVVGDLQILDLDTMRVRSVGRLDTPRAYHTATLLPDGRVTLWGGSPQDQRLAPSGARVEPSTGAANDVFVQEPDEGTLYVAASTPVDGADDVPLDQRLMIRFSRPVHVDAALIDHVRLTGRRAMSPSEW